METAPDDKAQCSSFGFLVLLEGSGFCARVWDLGVGLRFRAVKACSDIVVIAA